MGFSMVVGVVEVTSMIVIVVVAIMRIMRLLHRWIIIVRMIAVDYIGWYMVM